MTSRKIQALLLQPPPGDLTGPYPALAYLKSSAQQQGIQCRVRDLGIEALHYLSEQNRVEDLVRKAKARLDRYERRQSLSPNELLHLRLLHMTQGFGLKPNLIRKAMDALREERKFYDYPRYKKATRVLDAFYRTLSAVHFPTLVTPSQYPTATELGTMAEILRHCREEHNPFATFYKNLLFPQLAEQAPLVVGISMVFGNQSVQALVLGKLLKEHFPAIHVVMGGAYLSQWVTVMEDRQLNELFTCTDSVICGEGEAALAALCRHVADKAPLQDVPNLIHRDPETGLLRRPEHLQYTDISSQPPPDFDDLDLSTYITPQLVIPYCISRGCYWGRCAFCQNRYGDHEMRRYQTVPVEKAVDDLDHLSGKYGSDHFNFNNDVIDPTYLKRLSEVFISAGKHFIWNTDLRAEKTFRPDTCRLLNRAGLNSVAIGFESGCQKTLNNMDKGYRVETTQKVMGNMYRAGIATQAMGIFGFPDEAEYDAEMTLRFVEDNLDRISYYVIGLLMVLPGSRMHEKPDTYGVSGISYANNPLRTPEPVWTSDRRISADTVNRLYQRLARLEQFYAINEYPYVGGLATNHGFLYFRRFGPDVLKVLRKNEQDRHRRQTAALGLDQQLKPTGKTEPARLQFELPFTIATSMFPLEKAPSAPNTVPDTTAAPATIKSHYLVDALNEPIRIGPLELELLKAIDGKAMIPSILGQVPVSQWQRATYFLFYLLSSGLIACRG